MGGTKKNAVDRVIEQLEADRAQIDATIVRLRQAQAAAGTKKARKPRAAGSVERAINEGSIGTGKDRN